MARPQVENGHTRLANELVEALARTPLTSHESQVLWFLIRKTYGWSRKTDWIVLSQFSDGTGLERRDAHRAICRLHSRRMIIREKASPRRIRYGLQKDFDLWLSAFRPTPTSASGPTTSSAPEPTNETMSSASGPTTLSASERPTKEKKETTSSKNLGATSTGTDEPQGAQEEPLLRPEEARFLSAEMRETLGLPICQEPAPEEDESVNPGGARG